MIRIIRTEKTLEAFKGDKRIYLTTIGTGWGECTKEDAEHDLAKFLMLWGAEG